MKLHFDSSQEYQSDAVNAVADLFEGQQPLGGYFEYSTGSVGSFLSDIGVGNKLRLTREQVFSNLKIVQHRNGIPTDDADVHGMNFSVEMETGTGKTYVYLRTIYELNKRYGFKKYVIVVPSIAIREGVLKNLQITHEHFQSLFDNVPLTFQEYDSRGSGLRGFASGNTIQILVINIDSFAKDENIINKPSDKLTGRRPIEFIQSTNPIVIVDEPQNMETDLRKKAIANLQPLCTLRYSATHTNRYNLVYSLNPVRAYDLGLVKQIEVDAVFQQNDFNAAFIQVEKITRTGNSIKAKLLIDVNSSNGIQRKSVTVDKNKLDLFLLSNENVKYEGLKVYEIDFGNNVIHLSDGTTLSSGESRGGLNDAMLKYMLQRSVEEHLRKELQLLPKGIKVLTLFFIDRVKNYREYDASGLPLKGTFAKWFEDIYAAEIAKPQYTHLYKHPASAVHNGYFSQDNKGRIKDTGGETQADDDTYKLIMQEKEKLLDINEPLRFIFSHSALREGWDNPNVFQICTMNETRSELKKRQEIGRGLRLAVDQTGNRVYDKNVNRLTVIANSTFEAFAKALQREIEEDCGVNFTGRIRNRGERERVRLRKGFELDPKFLQLWEKIHFHTRYKVQYSSADLIQRSSRAIREMPPTTMPSIVASRRRLHITSEGLSGDVLSDSIAPGFEPTFEIPDPVSYIQSKTELTRRTIYEILKTSGKMNELFINPQMFLDNTVVAIRAVLGELMVDGIQYEKIGGKTYEMRLFEDNPLDIYLDQFTHAVRDKEETIYENYIPLDSGVENEFAKDCETSENIEFYFKLPSWFKINTPIGTYNPDWAVVLKGKKKVYFVAETKGAGQELRLSEQMKIRCGEAHFRNFDDVVYQRVSTVSEMIQIEQSRS